MSTDLPTRRSRRRRARGRFAGAFALTLAVLIVAGLAGAVVSITQGPRTSSVAIDTMAVAEASGQRLVFTANQPLADIDPAQVRVSPQAASSVVVSGRHVAVQFTYPLDPDTDYTVTIDDVESASGGPTSTLEHSFHTASPPISILQRRQDGDDAVFESNLSGDQAVPVFTANQIEDVRTTRNGLVVQTTDSDGLSALTAVESGTGKTTEFTLPGKGLVQGLQAADHEGLIGYIYSDQNVGSDGAIETALYIARSGDPAGEPQRVAVGEDTRVVQWAFVPQTSYLIVLSFDGQLRLVDTTDLEADPVPLGAALSIVGVEPGTGRAIIERGEGYRTIDLTTLDEEPFAEPADAAELGIAGPVTPTADGATLQVFTKMGADGYPQSQSVVRVAADGSVSTVLGLSDPGDAVLQVCASPSGKYAAVAVAPDLADNPYDLYQRPLPERVETHIVDAGDGSEVAVLQGSDIGWCAWAV